jgi:4-hydroxy-3-methylbut-2-enyl diphosphate reductase
MGIEKIVLAQPRGFCAGVERAVEIIDLAVQACPPPIFCRKEIVHNRHVVESFIRKGVRFVDELAEVPAGATVIFSAHGVSPEVWRDARAKNLDIIDATCPLVTKVHLEVRTFARRGYTILYVGHRAHDEVVGVRGEAPANVQLVQSVAEARRVEVPDPAKVVCLSQTTLSVDDTSGIISALKERFPQMETPPKSDICYATQNRQEAVKALARETDLVLVIGSSNSSNSNRLVDVAVTCGKPAHLIHGAEEIREEWFDGVQSVGVTSGASTPEVLVEGVVEALRRRGDAEITVLEVARENVTFALPRELARLQPAT